MEQNQYARWCVCRARHWKEKGVYLAKLRSVELNALMSLVTFSRSIQ